MSAQLKIIPTGTKYGRWVVISFIGRKQTGKYKMSYYRCKCICGTEKDVQLSNLLSGASVSCNCYRFEDQSRRQTLPAGTSATNTVLDVYKRNARKRNYEWSLEKEDFIKLIKSPCFYCNVNSSLKTTHGKDSITHNGIDRVNNKKGYILNNSVPCCKTCNQAKNNMTIEDFLTWIQRVNQNIKIKPELVIYQQPSL